MATVKSDAWKPEDKPASEPSKTAAHKAVDKLDEPDEGGSGGNTQTTTIEPAGQRKVEVKNLDEDKTTTVVARAGGYVVRDDGAGWVPDPDSLGTRGVLPGDG